MRFLSFASGSSGNCGLLRGGGVSLLVDAGLSLRRLRACLAEEELGLEDLDGVLVTHEHSDHISGLELLCRHADLPVYTSGGTARALLRLGKCRSEQVFALEPEEALCLGELRILGFETSHDAAQPFGFRVEGEEGALGLVTDLGWVSRGVRDAVSGCRAAVVEAVGTMLKGQASRSTEASRTTAAWRARVEAALPVRAMTGTPARSIMGRRRTISSDSPE